MMFVRNDATFQLLISAIVFRLITQKYYITFFSFFQQFILAFRTQIAVISREKTDLKLVWTYGIQLWRTTNISNTETLERFQYKTLRSNTNTSNKNTANIPSCPWHKNSEADYTLKQKVSRTA